jgi:hypothetical protein
MKRKTYLGIGLLVALLSACTTNDDVTEQTLPIAGYYKVRSMTSDVAVDINDDGYASNDMMDEMSDFFELSHRHYYDLEIKHNQHTGSSAKLIDFRLPHMNMYFEYPSTPQGFNTYTNSGPHYLFDYDYKNKAIHLEVSEVSNQSGEDFGRVEQVDVVNDENINATVKKKYYDFSTAQWVELTLDIKYHKADWPYNLD